MYTNAKKKGNTNLKYFTLGKKGTKNSKRVIKTKM